MNNSSPPKTALGFGIDDIHKIREQKHEKRREMTSQEICEDTRKGAERFLKLCGSPIDPAIEEEVINRLNTARREARS